MIDAPVWLLFGSLLATPLAMLPATAQAAPQAAAGHFEDTQKRFSLDLPSGWKFAPLPGDLKGVMFKRDLDGVPANFGIRFFDVDPGTSLDGLVRQLAAGLEAEPGYKLLAEELDTLAGLAAIRRRYVVFINGDNKWSKMAEDIVAIEGRRGVLVHMETVAESFGAVEDDLRAIVGSLVLRASKTASGAKAPAPRPAADNTGGPSMQGRWILIGNPDVTLELRRDGTFDLAGVRGVFRVEGPSLQLQPVDQPGESYRWRIEGSELVLTSPNLEEPARYKRDGAVVLPTQAPVVGRWEGQGHRLHLSPSGAAVADGISGTYTLQEGAIVIKPTRGKKAVILTYRMEAGALVVSGGGFGQDVKLERQP